MLYVQPYHTQRSAQYAQQGYPGYAHSGYASDDSNDVLDELSGIAEEVTQKVRRQIRRGYTYLKDHPVLCEAAYFTTVFALKLALYMVITKGAENGYEGSL